MNEWKPIKTAPKDGTVIQITALEPDGQPFEIWPMQWAHIQRNGLFPGRVGMWTHPSGQITWNDDGHGGGPTHWRPIADAPLTTPPQPPNAPSHEDEMNEAIRKVVEAMTAELRRQADFSEPGADPRMIQLDGHFDLEKLAQAVSEAAQEDRRLTDAAPALLAGAKEVLRGIRAVIQATVADGRPVPRYEGIAALSDAVAKAEPGWTVFATPKAADEPAADAAPEART